MKKKFLFFIFLLFFSHHYSYSENFETQNIDLKFNEDIEISKIENEIEVLKKRVTALKKIKNSKEKNNIKVALVLSGGGIKGYAHLGVLKILEKENIKIDYMTGTSIGALIAALYSTNHSINEISEILEKINVEKYLESGKDLSDLPIQRKENLKKYSVYVNYDKNFDYTLPKGIRDSQNIYLELKKYFKNYEHIKNFNELPIPLRIVATSLKTGNAKSFESGDLAKIVTASMAVPAILEPVDIENDSFVDGLLTRNLPVQDAYDMGADIVIASDVGRSVNENLSGNIFGVFNQILLIQANNTNKSEREKATILISPKIENINAMDSSKKNELTELGELAAEEKLSILKNLPHKKNADKNLLAKNNKIINITNIVYSKNIDKMTQKVLDNFFKDILDNPLSYEDIEKKILKSYNSKYINKIYYRVVNNTLYIDGEIGYPNKFGVGLNYRNDYGITLNIGTNLNFDNIIGKSVDLNFKFGDYLGANVEMSTSYGTDNKLGFFTNFSYNEEPFFLYRRSKSKFINRDSKFNLGIFKQLNNNSVISYGLSSKLSKLMLDSGPIEDHAYEYSENINNTYLRFKYDNLDSISVPMKGIKADIIYNFSNSFSKRKGNLYGPSYMFEFYYPISDKISLISNINGAILNGKDIKVNQYFKLGGIRSNINNNEFEFYGLKYQEKLLREFLSFGIGFRYKIFYSLYFTTKFNTMTYRESEFTENDRSKMWKTYTNGIGSSLLYDSPIGPIELMITSNFKRKDPLISFSIGYNLD